MNTMTPLELSALNAVDERKLNVRRQEALERSRRENENHIRAEYRARGLEPPAGTLTSLPMMLHIGWTIVEVDGRPTLVAPPPERRRNPDPEQRTRPEMPTTARSVGSLVDDVVRR